MAPDRPAHDDNGGNCEVEVTPEAAIEELAKILVWKLEHVDPSDPAVTWDELDEHDRECYRSCIKALLWRGGHLLRRAESYTLLPETT
jgi:hypothetical protein